MDIIEVEQVNKIFQAKKKEKGLAGSLKSIVKPKYQAISAVQDLSFSVDRGQILAFIGPNGAGKSTTIKMLTGILYRDTGSIRVLGIDPQKGRKKLSYKIGTVFGQKEQLWMHLTPYDNFMFFGSIYDLDNTATEKRIEELTKVFNLKDIINTPVKSLSLGQRIRCEIVASLIHNPEILFLDEPTIGLDPLVKESVREVVKKMNKELNTTIFLTRHDIGDIEKLCKRVVIINNGSLVLDSHIDKLKYNYLNRKIIEVKLNDRLRDDENIRSMEGITVLKDMNFGLKLEINTMKKNILDVVSLLGAEKIVDINISNIPLEEIISNIYKENQAAEPKAR